MRPRATKECEVLPVTEQASSQTPICVICLLRHFSDKARKHLTGAILIIGYSGPELDKGILLWAKNNPGQKTDLS